MRLCDSYRTVTLRWPANFVSFLCLQLIDFDQKLVFTVYKMTFTVYKNGFTVYTMFVGDLLILGVIYPYILF